MGRILASGAILIWPFMVSAQALDSGTAEEASSDRVHVNDLHATILQLLGFDHTKLTYKFQGRPFRLTDVKGEVVSKLLA